MDQDMREGLVDEATDIAREAGALKECELHRNILVNQFTDDSEVYKYANAKFTAGETGFATRRDLTDTIKELIDEASVDGCPECQRMLAD